jgi:hypothetical protein
VAVYFVKAVGTNRVKIGYTSNNARARIQQLKTSCPDELRIVHWLPDADRTVEKRLHRTFKTSHINREWFHYRPEISRYLGDHNLDLPVLDEVPNIALSLQDEIDLVHHRNFNKRYNNEISESEYIIREKALKFTTLCGEEELDHLFCLCDDKFDRVSPISESEQGWIEHCHEVRKKHAQKNG